jgi:hypothetical protein
MQGVIVANKSFLNGTPEFFFFSNRASADNIFNMAPKKEMQGFKSGAAQASVVDRHDLSIGEDIVDPKLLEVVDCV